MNTHELISEEEYRLQSEFAVAKVEKVFEGWTEEVQHHGVIVALCSEPSNKGYTDASSQGLVNFGLVFELWVLGFDRLEFDGDFFT